MLRIALITIAISGVAGWFYNTYCVTVRQYGARHHGETVIIIHADHPGCVMHDSGGGVGGGTLLYQKD